MYIQRIWTSYCSRSTTSTVATNSTFLSTNHMVQYPHNFMVIKIDSLMDFDCQFSLQIDRKFEFPRKDLLLQETLGEGEFGKVVSAQAFNLRGVQGNLEYAISLV